MNFDLSNRKALVCGGSQGIGEAIAIALSYVRAKVTLVARNEEKLNLIKNKLTGEGHGILVADLNDEVDLERLVNNVSSVGQLTSEEKDSAGSKKHPAKRSACCSISL